MGPKGLWGYAISSQINKPSTHHNIHTFFSLSLFLLCIFLLPGTELMSGIQASLAGVEILWEQPYCFPQQSYCSQATVYGWFDLDFFFPGLEWFSQRTKTGLSYCSDGCVGSKLEVLARLKMMTRYEWVCVCMWVHWCFQSSLALAFSWVCYEGKGHFLQECVSSVSAAEL